MTYRSSSSGRADSSSALQVQVLIPADAVVGDVLTVACAKSVSGTDPLSIASSNGGTYTQIGPASGVGTMGTNGRFNVWKHTIVAGDAGATLTITSTSTGRFVAVCHLEFGVSEANSVCVVTSSGSTSGAWPTPAATPILGTTGGTAVTIVMAQISSLPIVFTSSDTTVRISDSNAAGAGQNVAVGVGSEAFSGDSAYPSQGYLGSNSSGSRAMITVLYPSGSLTPPVADAGSDRTATVSTAVNLTGSGSDADGTIASYAWTQVSGPTVSLTGAATASVSFTAPSAPGTIVLQLQVTDDDGLTSTDTVTVTVVAVGQVARPSSDLTLTAVVRVPSDAVSVASVLDEAVTDDADYAELATGSVLKVALTPLASVASDSGWVATVRMSKTTGTGSHSVTVTLSQAGTTIGTRTFTDLTTSPADKVITLTTLEAQAIPDRTAPINVQFSSVTVA